MIQILNWFSEYGYLILFVGLFLELLFLPFPGSSVMIISGILAHQGELNYFLCILIAFLGTSLGMLSTYIIGSSVGYSFFEKYGSKFFMGKKRMDNVQKWFNRFGTKVVFISYFIPGVRHFTGYFSGIVKLKFKVFFFYTLAGAMSWCIFSVSLGYFFGERWEFILQLLKYYGAPIIIICILGYIWWRFRFKKRNK